MKPVVTLILIAAALAVPGAADAARYAVGVAPGRDAEAVARALEARTGGSASRIGPFAVELRAASTRGVAGIRGVTYVERLREHRRVAFVRPTRSSSGSGTRPPFARSTRG